MFTNLLGKIFGHQTETTTPPAAPAPSSTPATPANPAAAPTQGSTPFVVASVTPPAAKPVVDVTAILNGLAAKNPEKLDWKRSIVDLLKLVGMDSSLAARKELADELAYTGDKGDSATMNVWLHKAVLKKIAENGGTVPAELLD
jgi:hypothetical protein